MRFTFETCKSDSNECETNLKIKAWLKDKYIAVIYNERKFIPNDFNNPIQLKQGVKYYKI